MGVLSDIGQKIRAWRNARNPQSNVTWNDLGHLFESLTNLQYSEIDNAPLWAQEGVAGGDLSGNYPNPTVTGLDTYPLSLTGALTGDTIQYDGSKWVRIQPRPPGGVWPYKADTRAGTDPVAGSITWSDSTQINSTYLKVNKGCDSVIDIDYFIPYWLNHHILVQQQDDSANYQWWHCNGVSKSGSVYTLQVGLMSSLGTGSTNFPNNKQLFISVFQ